MSTTETPVILRLSEMARAKLAEKAASTGQDMSAVASDLLEQVIRRGSIAEIMAPVRKQVGESGIGNEGLDALLSGELEAHRLEKKAKSA